MRRALAQALSVAALTIPWFAPTPAAAAHPDIDIIELAAGELSGEINVFLDHDAWVARPEMEFGLSDTVGLEIQAEFLDARSGATALGDVSAQLMMSLSPDRSFGIAAEVGYNPEEENTVSEVFLFASREAGSWAIALNAGLEREKGDTATVYAWRIERELAAHWSVGVEGGGEIPFDGRERVQVLGPVLGARIGSLELSLSWLFGMGAGDVARIGLERAF